MCVFTFICLPFSASFPFASLSPPLFIHTTQSTHNISTTRDVDDEEMCEGEGQKDITAERRVLCQNGVQKNITCRNPSHKDAELHRDVCFVLTVDVVDTNDTLGAESEKEEEEEREAPNEEKESVKKIDYGTWFKKALYLLYS